MIERKMETFMEQRHFLKVSRYTASKLGPFEVQLINVQPIPLSKSPVLKRKRPQ